MKSVIIKRMSIIKLICFTLSLSIPMFIYSQNRREIKDFNRSFSFTNTYTINSETNTRSDTISDFTCIAKFYIDKNGEGTFDFSNEVSNSHTLVRINYSQLKTSNQFNYLIFGGEHFERPEIIMITISINQKSNIVEKLVIYNEGIKKAYVFY